ncbi:PREDICTED: disease resistance protein RML1A-like [Camelina sativa]|uniref:Disease resistance protein RML1A-like n=1 Tax=Camelina sativa TaxID=90675 RepID=A0ABM0U376_CAMSA|nr:PREDICTED: disease resistance protein RML1A-like [Camelina sativa]
MWEALLDRLETSIDRNIEGALRVGYDCLHEEEQALFLYVAVFFNYHKDDHVIAMLADSNLDVKNGLKILTNKSLIHTSTSGIIVMHKLLQLVGRQAIHRQEPWKRNILIDADEICYVLENDKDSRAALGISLDTSRIKKVFINKGVFKRMRNLQFLSIYNTRNVKNDRVDIHEDFEFPPHLRLFRWEAYPRNALPTTFHPEYLVGLDLQESHLEKLWQGTQVKLFTWNIIMFFLCLCFKTATSKSQENGFDTILSFKGTSRSFKCYKSPEIGTESLQEFGRDSFLLFGT